MSSQSEHDDPDWSLLPRNPSGFFGLASGFDRKDLKRAYNKLIRRYKPEKHPEEFQRIRAAYEELERDLRYGVGELNDPAADVWEHAQESQAARRRRPVPEEEDEPFVREPKQSAPEDPFDLEVIAARLEKGEASPRDYYKRLKDKQNKTPPDYYALAVLSDVVQRGDQLWFLRWLLEGLKAWPGEPALSRLIHGFLCGPVETASLPKILVACSKAAPHDGFFVLTEGAWDRLLRTQPFPVFVQTLKACEKQLAEGGESDPAISGRITFYVHAIRFAQWKEQGSGAWWRSALEFVDSHFDQAPEHLTGDLDLLGVVAEYLAVRERFVASHELCARLDHALEAALTGDQIDADREMLACQRELLARSDEIGAALPLEENELQFPFFTLWGWVANDAADRLTTQEEGEIDYGLWRQKVTGLLTHIHHRNHGTGLVWAVSRLSLSLLKGLTPILIGVSSFALPLMAGMFVLDLLKDADSGVNADLVLVAGLLAVAFAAFVTFYFTRKLWKLLDEHWTHPMERGMAMRCYRRNWRPQVVAFLERSMLDYFTLRALVSERADEVQGNAPWIDHHVQRDVGLAVYSIALRFRV